MLSSDTGERLPQTGKAHQRIRPSNERACFDQIRNRKERSMLTLFIIFALMPVFVFVGMTAQRWLLKDVAEKRDPEWELYQQRYD
jgi:hypothetical protein